MSGTALDMMTARVADSREPEGEAVMRTLLGIVLSVIAIGVLLVAYGLLSPRANATPPAWNGVPVAADPGGDAYRLARPMLGRERAEVADRMPPPQVRVR